MGTLPALESSASAVGLMAGLGAGPLGLRVSGAIDAAGTPASFVAPRNAESSGAWSLDADLELGTARTYLDVFGLRPAAFAGLGMRAVAYRPTFDAGVETANIPIYSYGGRLALPVISWLSLEGEARRRSALDRGWSGVVDGWEYRVGFALSFGGGTTARTPAHEPGGRPAGRVVYGGARSEAEAARIADSAIRSGERYIGTRYTWGGESPGEGFDCSGFVRYVFGQQGVHLPRVSRQQAHAGEPLRRSFSGLARGDLMFFAGDDGVIDHVAIYAGNGRILHSTSSGGGVRYDELSGSRGSWFTSHFVAARRVITVQDAPAYAARATQALPLEEAFEAVTEYDRGDEAPSP